MSQIEIKGFVPESFDGIEFYMRVEDVKKIESFYREERIDTKLRYAEDYPLIGVRGKLASRCKPNDRVLLTLETTQRAGKIGIRNIDVRVLP